MLTAILSPANPSTVSNPSVGPKSDPADSAKTDTGKPTAGNTAKAAKNHPGPSARTHSTADITTPRTSPHRSVGIHQAAIAPATNATPPATTNASRRRRCFAASGCSFVIPRPCPPARAPVKSRPKTKPTSTP